MSAEEQIERLEHSVQVLLDEVEGLPSDVLHREPSAGEWPVMSTLAHVAEVLPYWAREASRVAVSPGERFGRTPEDPRRLEAISEHAHDSLQAMVPHLRASLSECVATLRSIPGDSWSVSGEHVTRGPMSVAQIVETLIVSHAEEHVAQTEATLKALQPAPH